MTVAYESGYTLPSGTLPLKHARVVHKGNSLVPITITASAELPLYPGSAANSGDTVDRWRPVVSGVTTATLAYEMASAQEADCFAIAAHNLGTIGATLTLQHDSNGDDTWTTIGAVAPADDSPILFIFEPITSDKWRIQVSGGDTPEVGVFRVAKALQMERPFYGGFAPTPMSRNTEVRGNLSGSGQLLGRSKERTTLSSSYTWKNLSYDWVVANLGGKNGLIISVEDEPVFIAWRPFDVGDCDYVMNPKTSSPQAQGVRDLFDFSMSGDALAYE